MTYQPGDDVIVTFDELDHPGEVLNTTGDYVMCRIHTDPEWDYGAITSRLAPESTVMVPTRNVRKSQ
ncbi:MAG: hypothetical protein E6Q97_25275 [Desulfurellales bacterium]|nr:MAG: hypothetical protein E6Q97_25275 [Desulfurellales bacterium]